MYAYSRVLLLLSLFSPFPTTTCNDDFHTHAEYCQEYYSLHLLIHSWYHGEFQHSMHRTFDPPFFKWSPHWSIYRFWYLLYPNEWLSTVVQLNNRVVEWSFKNFILSRLKMTVWHCLVINVSHGPPLIVGSFISILGPDNHSCSWIRVASLQIQNQAVEFTDHEGVSDVPLLVLTSMVRIPDDLGASIIISSTDIQSHAILVPQTVIVIIPHPELNTESC